MIVRTSAKSRLISPGRDEVGDSLHALAENVVDHPERIRHGRRLLDDLEQAVVLDDDERVDVLAQRLDALLGLVGTGRPSSERRRDDADRQRPELPSDLCDDRSAARAGPTALTGGDEDHVRTLERFLQLVATLLGGRETDLRVGAGASRASPASRCGSSRRPPS
jgi:hypothetical protein